MVGARIFVAVAFVILGASFLASTGLLIFEFRELDWLTMVVVHSHLFLFYPVFGLLLSPILASAAMLLAFAALLAWGFRLEMAEPGRHRRAGGSLVGSREARPSAVRSAGQAPWRGAHVH